MSEQDIQKSILDYLRLRGHLAWKNRAVGIYNRARDCYIPVPQGERGVSDIIGCTKDGLFFAIEVKAAKGRATPDQTAFLESVKKRNGIAIVARSIEDVQEAGL